MTIELSSRRAQRLPSIGVERYPLFNRPAVLLSRLRVHPVEGGDCRAG